MRVGLPHMGNLYIPLKTLFHELDVDLVVPPLNSRRTLSLGVRYSPEGLCIPFKLTLGNLIEASELGADTLLMPGGYGICRLGYYARSQQRVLQDLGYKSEIMELGVSEQKLLGFLKMIKHLANNAPWTKIISAFRFGLAKLNAIDRMEREVHKIRPREVVKGTVNKIYARSMQAIDDVANYRDLKKVQTGYLQEMNNVIQKNIQPLVVGIMGEFYVVLEPFSNLDIENELGKLGVEVRRTTFISEWTKFSLFFGFLGLTQKAAIHKAAMPYLKRDIGGDGWESVGEKVLHAGRYDGIIHLAPFTCMPEIVAQNIMPSTKESIPVLSVLCDEQMGKQGMITRVEAFVDLLKRRRQRSENAAGV